MKIKSKVNASGNIINDLTDLINALSNGISKGLSGLLDLGIKYRDSKTNKDKKLNVEYEDTHKDKKGNPVFTIVITDGEGNDAGHRLKCKLIKLDDEDMDETLYNIHFQDEHGNIYQQSEVRDDPKDFDKAVRRAVDHFYHMDTYDSTVVDENGNEKDSAFGGTLMDIDHTPNKIRATFRKVVSGQDVDIQLTRICANCSGAKAFADMTAIAADDAFVAMIPDDGSEATFEVTDSDEGYEVDPASNTEEDASSDTLMSLISLMSFGYKVALDAKAIHWNSKGEEFLELHELSEMTYHMVDDIIDALAEYTMEKCFMCPHPVDMMQSLSSLDVTSGFNKLQGLTVIKDDIDQFVDELSSYQCNYDSDFQSKIDEWSRDLKSLADYKIARTLS